MLFFHPGITRKILFILFILTTLFLSCNKDIVVENYNGNNPVNIENRLFFIIHGDGSYLYHDQGGTELQADEEILKKAIQTAKSLKNSEVLIFHQRIKRHFLFFFPKKDRDFYYFRNERLITKYSYSSVGNLFSTNEEFLLLANSIMKSNQYVHNYLFYYGHEIPEKNLIGYDSSFPERRFTIDTAAVILNKLTAKINQRFDLVTLSTCNNGSPYSIFRILPYSDYVLASPGNLHLSYIDCRDLSKSLNNKLSPDKVIGELTKSAYDSLCIHTSSVVVLSLYKRALVLPALERIFNSNKSLITSTGNGSEYIDCAEYDSLFSGTSVKNGTTVYYRAPLFGKMQNVKSHSGWVCTKNKTAE